MEILHGLRLLQSPTTSYFEPRDISDEKVAVLKLIGEEGNPGIAGSLIPFLKDESRPVRAATCQAIEQLFARIRTKSAYYNAMRHCDISQVDLDYYSTEFSKAQCVVLYAIGSLNSDGRVREKAVKMLSDIKDAGAIPFLMFRLADWVPTVRTVAAERFANFFSGEYLDALIENLPMLEWLRSVERVDLSDIHRDIVQFIVVANRPYVIKHFKKFDDKVRLVLSGYFSRYIGNDRNDIELLLTDKHFLVRRLVFDHLALLKRLDFQRLLKDKSPRIRIKMLRLLSGEADFDQQISRHIADRSAEIRFFVRYSLKMDDEAVAKLYYENLLADNELIGSMAGLAEVKGRKYVAAVTPFLDSNIVSVKKAAFLSLQKLDEHAAYQFALANLGSVLPGIRSLSVDFLAHRSNDEVLTKARALYKEGNYGIKKSMLKLFSRGRMWASIGDIIIGTIDGDEQIRDLSYGYLLRFKKRIVNVFTSPGQSDIDGLHQTFNMAYKIHEEKKYFKHNPLEGLDFYFR